jgi:hypothetical protein
MFLVEHLLILLESLRDEAEDTLTVALVEPHPWLLRLNHVLKPRLCFLPSDRCVLRCNLAVPHNRLGRAKVDVVFNRMCQR